jgi:predicted lipoprotein with Yx(FWY)xxD motif
MTEAAAAVPERREAAMTTAPAPAAQVRRPRRTTGARLAGVAGFAGVAFLLAACGGGGTTGGSAYGAARPSPSNAGTAATVDLRGSEHGKVLVDAQGRTLYLFEADQGGKPSCSGACASLWPPYLSAGAPHAGAGVARNLLGTAPGAAGGTQVTYAGHPLYYFSGDKAPGDATGQGLDDFGAAWYVVGANGHEVDDD